MGSESKLKRSNSAESGLGMLQRTATQQVDDLVSVTVRKNEPNQKAGISLVERLGSVYVTKVTENGLFHNTEVEIGDLVLSINGKRLGKGEGAREIIKHIGSAKAKVTMVVKKSSRKAHRGVRSLSPRTRRRKSKSGKVYKEAIHRNADGSMKLDLNPNVETFKKRDEMTKEQIPVDAKKLVPSQDVGVMFKLIDNKLFVTGIALDSIFFDTDLELGDRVVSVNDMNFVNYADAGYAKKLLQKSKCDITLVVEKGHTEFNSKTDTDKEHNRALLNNNNNNNSVQPKKSKSTTSISSTGSGSNSNRSSTKRSSSFNKNDSPDRISTGSHSNRSSTKRSYLLNKNNDSATDNKISRGSNSNSNRSSSKRSSLKNNDSNSNRSSSKRSVRSSVLNKHEDSESSLLSSDDDNDDGANNDDSFAADNNLVVGGESPQPQRILSKAAIEDSKGKISAGGKVVSRAGKPIKMTRSSPTTTNIKQAPAIKNAAAAVATKSPAAGGSSIPDDISEESPLDRYTIRKPGKSAVPLIQTATKSPASAQRMATGTNMKNPNKKYNKSNMACDSSESSMDEELEPIRTSSSPQNKASSSSSSSLSLQQSNSSASRFHASLNGSIKWEDYDGDYMKVTVRKQSMEESGISLMKTEGKFILTQLPDHEKRISPGMQVLAINGIANLNTIIKADDIIKRSNVSVVLYIAFNEPIENNWNCPCCGRPMNAEGCHSQTPQQQQSQQQSKSTVLKAAIPPPPPPTATTNRNAATSIKPSPSGGATAVIRHDSFSTVTDGSINSSAKSLTSSVNSSVSESVKTLIVNNHAPPGQRLPSSKQQSRPPGSHHLNNLYNFDDFESDSETEDKLSQQQSASSASTPTMTTKRKQAPQPQSSPSSQSQQQCRPAISRYSPNDRFVVRVTIKTSDHPNAGINFFDYKGSIYVMDVSEDGPFYHTAINKGDKVLSINRRKASLIKSAADALSLVQEKQAVNIFALRPDPDDEEYKEAFSKFPT